MGIDRADLLNATNWRRYPQGHVNHYRDPWTGERLCDGSRDAPATAVPYSHLECSRCRRKADRILSKEAPDA